MYADVMTTFVLFSMLSLGYLQGFPLHICLIGFPAWASLPYILMCCKYIYKWQKIKQGQEQDSKVQEQMGKRASIKRPVNKQDKSWSPLGLSTFVGSPHLEETTYI